MCEQGAARFSGYKSPGSQAKRSPSGSQGVAPEDDHASKRSKAFTPGEEPSSATADSSVTLARGIADAPASSSEVQMSVRTTMLQLPGKVGAAKQSHDFRQGGDACFDCAWLLQH